MAPTNIFDHRALRFDLNPREAASATTLGPATYLGLGIGVGGALLLAIIIVVVQVVKKHREHKRLIEVLEVEEAVQVARAQEVGNIARPASAVRRSSLNPLQARAGWGALSSTETVDEPDSERRKSSRKHSSASSPKRVKQRGIQLKRLKRLTVILESRRSRNASSPTMLLQRTRATPEVEQQQMSASQGITKPYAMRKVSDDVFVCPGSPKPDILPSFAIRSPGQYGARIANQENVKASRSRSVGALGIPDQRQSVSTIRHVRPSMHLRSVSLGVPISRPPSCPVPPLPVIEPQSKAGDISVRQGLCVSRMSSSSRESTGSSVLVSSPILMMHDEPMRSPSLAQAVAENDDASLKTVAMRTWDKPLVKPKQGHGPRNMSKSEASIRSNIASYSADSLSGDPVSTTHIDISDEERQRLSIPQTGLAAQISISRVSSSNSMNSYTGIQKITTPRKPKRSSVSASGSPAERRKTSVLREVSGNLLGPSRQPSTATQDSARSSNGNPFQWDQPFPKPSALKGSPNARKGHRRQNCVRISTLTPQVLGPPPSRPTSPSIMLGIEEESGDEQEAVDSTRLRFVTNHRLSRPPSGGNFAQNLRIQTLRASLTPSSPTLSAWNAYQEHGLPSLPSDSQLSVSPMTRSASRLSDRSSPFTIPSFPSPSKATLTEIQMSQPVPQFCLSRPSSERDQESSSPFGLQLSSDHDIPSSPPVLVSRREAYDPAHPAWSNVTFDPPQHTEYDPASRSWLDAVEPERSSPLFPFAVKAMEDTIADKENFPPQTLPSSFEGSLPDTPPCSPKTMPEGFHPFLYEGSYNFEHPLTAEEKLTSSNASAIMARLPTKTPDFPGAPILPPPNDLEGYNQTTPQRPLPQLTSIRHRSISNTAPHPLHYAPPPPMPTIPSSDIDPDEPSIDIDMDIAFPPPLNLSTKSTPLGPRCQPPQSVLKHAMALRRMNSEVNHTADAVWGDPEQRESRQYVRMGREASPLLPWIGEVGAGGDESVGDLNALFDFGFAAADAGGGAEVNGEGCGGLPVFSSALDEIDLAVVERKLDGALAGFEADDYALEAGDVRCDRNQVEEAAPASCQWEQGLNFWKGREWAGFGAKDNAGGIEDVTPKKRNLFEDGAESWRKSIQMTPKSLYDSDGFLRAT